MVGNFTTIIKSEPIFAHLNKIPLLKRCYGNNLQIYISKIALLLLQNFKF